jgi:hypothetical protein
MERLIISEGYKADVKKFIETFDAVAALQVNTLLISISNSNRAKHCLLSGTWQWIKP